MVIETKELGGRECFITTWAPLLWSPFYVSTQKCWYLNPLPPIWPLGCTELYTGPWAFCLNPCRVSPLLSHHAGAASFNGLAFLFSLLTHGKVTQKATSKAITWYVSLHTPCQIQPGMWRAQLPGMLLEVCFHSSQVSDEQAACGTHQGVGLCPRSVL